MLVVAGRLVIHPAQISLKKKVGVGKFQCARKLSKGFFGMLLIILC